MRDKFSRLASILIIALCLAWAVPCCHAQQGKKPFTIADDVGLTAFGNRTAQQAIRFSPEGSYLAVLTVRGRLDLNCVEDSLSFYRSTDIERFLNHEPNRHAQFKSENPTPTPSKMTAAIFTVCDGG